MTGRIVILNGTSSSGKTSLARALQEQLLPEVWLLLGVDAFISALPWGLYGTSAGHDISSNGSISIGPVWLEQQRCWRAAVVELVRAGANVILDEVFLRGAEEQREWRAAFGDEAVPRFIGVRCDVEVAEARERERGDRSRGMARTQAEVVHVGVTYDAEVDTTSTAPDALAAQLRVG
jgi:chloramphenicol 3-O phosphotransferase